MQCLVSPARCFSHSNQLQQKKGGRCKPFSNKKENQEKKEQLYIYLLIYILNIYIYIYTFIYTYIFILYINILYTYLPFPPNPCVDSGSASGFEVYHLETGSVYGVLTLGTEKNGHRAAGTVKSWEHWEPRNGGFNPSSVCCGVCFFFVGHKVETNAKHHFFLSPKKTCNTCIK